MSGFGSLSIPKMFVCVHADLLFLYLCRCMRAKIPLWNLEYIA